MKGILKAFRIGLPEALIIGLGLVLLYMLIPLFINGGSLLVVEANQPLLIIEMVVAVAILAYGIRRMGQLIRGKHND